MWKCFNLLQYHKRKHVHEPKNILVEAEKCDGTSTSTGTGRNTSMYKNQADNFLGIESLHNFGNKDPIECVGVKNVPVDIFENITKIFGFLQPHA